MEKRILPKRETAILSFAVALIMLAACLGTMPVCPALTPPEGYKMVWSDEFSSPTLNEDEWYYRTWGYSPWSICLPQNVSVEDGKVRIALKEEEYEGNRYTTGGIITERRYKYGYFEVAAKMDSGAGWHEAFWAAYSKNRIVPPELKGKDHLEIDCFEHYGFHDPYRFSYGLILWGNPQSSIRQGNISRDEKRTSDSLAGDFHTYGYEFTPDYLNFFFDGELLKTVDTRLAPQHEEYLWLTCVVVKMDAATSGSCYFDYLRCYQINLDSQIYKDRRDHFLARIDEARGTLASAGVDLWIEAEDFIRKGGWQIQIGDDWMILRGHTLENPDSETRDLVARTMIPVKEAGRYRMWVRSRDFAENSPGRRQFRAAVNGIVSSQVFGSHSREGFAWEDGGVFDLPADLLTVELFDSSQFWPKCAKILLTTDLDFVPDGPGGYGNVEHRWEENRLKTAFPEE
ncbi:glycoside hydrolase family 16 protein [bacterium]|nr:glycoside hydrolase family 16 protein [bacterium]